MTTTTTTSSSSSITDTFFVLLNSAQESKPCVTQALGNAVATLDDDNEFCIYLGYRGLSSREKAVHIHGKASIGSDAGVLYSLSKGASKTDCVYLKDKEVNWLKRKLLYVNVHTTKCPDGEIRGKILPVG